MADLSFLDNLYGIQPTQDYGAAPQQPAGDDTAAALHDLLSSLENPTVPQPQQPKQYQRVLGALGDALGSMASVRAGGAPVQVGPFAANLQARQSAYEKQQLEAQQGMAETRNKVRIGAFEEGLRAKREKEVAAVRNQQKQRAFQQKTFQAMDAQGKPVSVPYNYNPNTGTLAPIPGYEEGFQRYVRPLLASGINTETGEMEFRLIDPFSGAGVGSNPQGGGQEGGGIDTLKPKPTPATVQDISDTTQLLRNIDKIRSNPLVAQGDIFERGKRMGQELVRAIPVLGPQASAGINPDIEKFEADIDNVRSRVQLLLTGKAVNSTEIKRLVGLIPAGSTAVDPQFFNDSMDRFSQEFTNAMRRQARLNPALFTPDELVSLGMTSARNEPNAGETPEQKKARFKAKYGITP